MFHRFAHHIFHDLVVGIEQIVAVHAWLARDAGGNHNDVRIRGVGVILCAEYVRVPFLDRHSLQQVKALALRYAFNDIDQHYIGQFLGRKPMSCRRAHVSRTYDCHFRAH